MPILVSPDKIEAWKASLERATKEKVRVWRSKRGFRAHSQGSNAIYTVMAHRQDGEIFISCECKGAMNRGHCKHVAALARRFHNKGETVRV